MLPSRQQDHAAVCRLECSESMKYSAVLGQALPTLSFFMTEGCPSGDLKGEPDVTTATASASMPLPSSKLPGELGPCMKYNPRVK